YTQALDDGLKVKHLLNVACDELPHFVDNKEEALPRAAPLHELVGSVCKLPRSNVRTLLDASHPGVGRRIGPRSHRVHDLARTAKREHAHALVSVPLLVKPLPVELLEFSEAAFCLKRDLELGEIQILCVPEALEKQPVHDFR